MKRAHLLATYALAALGITHVGMAPVFFDDFSMQVMWYVAQGLMGLFVAFLNMASGRLSWREARIAALTHVANLLCLVFAVLYATTDPSAPSFVAVGLLVVLGGAGLAAWRARTDDDA